jgi:hypothetical protein
MINRIYWDLDHTLIYADFPEVVSEFDVGIAIDGDIYHIKINPASYSLLSFSRNLVGANNVWLLTASIREYAEAVNRACDFKFPTDQILAREDISTLLPLCKWDAEFKNPHKHKNNVLIDNLPSRYNEEKMIVGGVLLDNYLQVEDYYGVYDERFADKVRQFLNEKHEEAN